MKISVRTVTIALVLAASAAGVALAQDSSSPAGPSPAPAASSSAPADSAADPSATAQGPAASSQSPAGDPAVQHVTNGPVPDTPASRAANGGPMSNGGQATKPAGN